MTLLTELEQGWSVTEQWVVSEIQKGWNALVSAEQTLVVDVNSILGWITANQKTLQTDITTALELIAPVAALVPGAAPAVTVATTALDASEAAIDALSGAIVNGSTPMSVVSSAYQTYKTAANAVSAVVAAAAQQPSNVTTPTATVSTGTN